MNSSSSPLLPHLGHADFEALVAVVRTSPNDCAPLLVLADWLADRGDALAESLTRSSNIRQFEFHIAAARFEQITGRSIEELATRLCRRIVESQRKTLER